jgi:hypothetical protein
VALNLPSDLVLEVAQAADPAAAQSVTSRLMRLGGVTAGQGDEFSQVINGLKSPAASIDKTLPATGPEIGDQSGITRASTSKQVYQQFEALVLQNLFELMMPQDTEGVFGKGTAGEMWKSMLAQQIGQQVAKADGPKIFSRVFPFEPESAESRTWRPGGGVTSAATAENTTRSFGERS